MEFVYGLYRPDGQDEHGAAVDAVAAYVPAAHVEQPVAPGDDTASKQQTSASSLIPSSTHEAVYHAEPEPAGHVIHDVAEEAVEYWPPGHNGQEFGVPYPEAYDPGRQSLQ